MEEFMEELIKYFTDQGVSRGLAITYIIVSAVLALMAIVALVMRIVVVVKYFKGNHTKTKNGKTSFEVAEETLKKLGLQDVQVKKAGIFRAFFIGNSYSVRQKTIFLRGSIANKDSITAVSLALQKVALAKMDHDGKNSVRIRNRAQILSLVGPILFLPVVILGFLADLLLFSALGMFSIVGIAVGLVFVISGFVATFLNLPVEKKANDYALKIIDETGILDKEERAIAKKVFDAYIVAYVCEFIVAILRIVQIVLEIVMNSQINSKN